MKNVSCEYDRWLVVYNEEIVILFAGVPEIIPKFNFFVDGYF